ncbi:MAG: hypothetical protein M5U19_19940 [Microthrixaceae bacterium]|nr:hypothetical protein [Microthrixaceae bacterium]
MEVARRAEVVAVVRMLSWRYNDPGRIVAERLGATSAQTWYPPMGGNTPQMMLNRICTQITEGQLDVALLCGAEAWNTRTNAKRAGTRAEWESQDPPSCPTGAARRPSISAIRPSTPWGSSLPCSPIRCSRQRSCTRSPPSTPTAPYATRSTSWARCGRASRAAAHNPYAWNRSELSGPEITTATDSNRYVGWPYTKRMVSYPDVDMASALVVTSAQAATSAGVPRDRWIFPWSGTDGTDLVMSERESFVRSPSIGTAGRRALELAGLTLEQIDHLDVYSCFPRRCSSSARSSTSTR